MPSCAFLRAVRRRMRMCLHARFCAQCAVGHIWPPTPRAFLGKRGQALLRDMRVRSACGQCMWCESRDRVHKRRRSPREARGARGSQRPLARREAHPGGRLNINPGEPRRWLNLEGQWFFLLLPCCLIARSQCSCRACRSSRSPAVLLREVLCGAASHGNSCAP